MKERTALKRAMSLANGTKFGRRKKVADHCRIVTARRMKDNGHTVRDIAKYLGVSRATLYRYLVDQAASPVGGNNGGAFPTGVTTKALAPNGGSGALRSPPRGQ